jgi:hypothetical protein
MIELAVDDFRNAIGRHSEMACQSRSAHLEGLQFLSRMFSWMNN